MKFGKTQNFTDATTRSMLLIILLSQQNWPKWRRWKSRKDKMEQINKQMKKHYVELDVSL